VEQYQGADACIEVLNARGDESVFSSPVAVRGSSRRIVRTCKQIKPTPDLYYASMNQWPCQFAL
jgi:hypothetical protein